MTDADPSHITKLDYSALSIQQHRLYLRVVDLLTQSGKWNCGTLRTRLLEEEEIDSPVRKYLKSRLILWKALHKIEDDVFGLRGGKRVDKPRILFLWHPSNDIKGLTPEGQFLRELSAQMVHEFDSRVRRDRVLRISISGSVASYLLEEILADLRSDPQSMQFQLVRADATCILPNNMIARAETDCYIGWDFGFKSNGEIAHQIQPIRINDSEAPVCLIFHALHPFAQWVKDKYREADGSLEVVEQRLLGELRRYPILYPAKFSKLEHMARTLNRSKDRPLALDGFHSVVSHVGMRLGVGLFPHWPSVLKRLQHENQICHVPFPEGSLFRETQLHLTYYKLIDGSRSPETDVWYDRFCRLFSRWSNGSGVETWMPVPWEQPFGELDSSMLRSNWVGHSIELGYGKIPAPEWVSGDWFFSMARRNAGSSATYPLKVKGQHQPHSRSPGSRYSGDLHEHSLQLVSEPQVGTQVTISLVQVLERAGNGDSKDRIVLGCRHSSNVGATVVPFFLRPADMRISANDYLDIGRLVECHLKAHPPNNRPRDRAIDSLDDD